MPDARPLADEWEEFRLSLVRNDFLYRLHRRIGLIPEDGSGVARRALFWMAFTWIPLAVWGALNGRLVAGAVPETLLSHLTVHARLLIGIPVLHMAEAATAGVLGTILPFMVTSGLVPPASVPAFKAALQATARLRDRTLPWVVIGVLVAISTVYLSRAAGAEEIAWARNPDGGLGFGAWWLLLSRVVFSVFLGAWLWRLVLVFLLFRRLSGIGLALAPAHSDRSAGLGFLEWLPMMFAPVAFAISAVSSSHWGHQVLYHGVHVKEIQPLMIALAVILLALFLSPNLALSGLLRRTKKAALVQYGGLVRRQGRQVHERWIEGKQVEDDGLLGAPELGPVADLNTMYESVHKMRTVPLGLPSVAFILLPAVVPMVPVLAIEVPIKELLKGLVKALM